MAIDLQQFHEVFFQESLEGLEIMEQALLTIQDGEEPDPETINTIFRAAHSIKGGSGTFGFSEIADFTHVLETLLDEARDGKRSLGADAVDLLLKACDCLHEMVVSLQAGELVNNSAVSPLVAAFDVMLRGDTVVAAQSESAVSSSESPHVSVDSFSSTNPLAVLEASFDTLLGNDTSQPKLSNSPAVVDPPKEGVTTPKRWKISFHPEPQILMTGNEPLRIFRELAALGVLKTEAHTSHIPEFEQLLVDECFIHWTLWLDADVDRDDIEEVFDWVIDECKLDITLVDENNVAVTEFAGKDEGDLARAEKAASNENADEPVTVLEPSAPVLVETADDVAKPEKKAPAAAANSSIRVDIDKVDGLINLVGELVITQSMLSELGNDFDVSKLERLASGLEQLQQNTRELQESVMRIRMLPISFAFNRFPRMIRDLSIKMAKKVELKLSGEQTELDKTVMEQIGDPLVHLVRNAIDHGLETPEQRLAAGKNEIGTIHLDAFHKGGNIVIEIRDDGNGIDPQIILQKAREKGIVASDQELSEQEIYSLIFEPGFSTAAVVSDVSGRGVGMDVVRRNIKSLGGRIEIESELGKGSTFRVHLPLTLAILDGQLVRVGSEVYIIPLISIVESLQIKTELVNRVSGNMTLYRLREDNVPIVPISQEFGVAADNTELENGLLVVVEGDGQKMGLLVDDLLAQQQVVIKSLESNYKRIEGISGATILGDGSVSMILDIPGFIRRVTEGANRQHQAA